MARSLTASFLLFALAFGAQAQGLRRWASASARGLKGKVHTLISRCSDIAGKYETRYKYEFARDGELMVIESPQFKSPIFIRQHKVTKRNVRGDIEEVSIIHHGEVVEKEKYAIEYDSVGNWVKAMTFVMREYEMEGGDWKAGEWKARNICQRTIEYYP